MNTLNSKHNATLANGTTYSNCTFSNRSDISKMIKTLTCLLLICTLSNSTSIAQSDIKKPVSGFIDPNIYYDVRGYSTLTLNTLYNFNSKFQYFSFYNFDGTYRSESNDVTGFYTEQNLRYKLGERSPLKITNQNVLKSGADNDLYRLGILWTISATKGLDSLFKKINMALMVNIHAVQWSQASDITVMPQLEYVYRINLLKKRAYLAAFCDQTFNYSNNTVNFSWVTEHQLGIKLAKGLHLITEFRYNTYKVDEDKMGVGMGLEYFMKF